MLLRVISLVTLATGNYVSLLSYYVLLMQMYFRDLVFGTEFLEYSYQCSVTYIILDYFIMLKADQ